MEFTYAKSTKVARLRHKLISLLSLSRSLALPPLFSLSIFKIWNAYPQML